MARVRRDNDARYALRASFVDENGNVLTGDTITINSVAVGISATDVSNWNEAYSWGDHALAGYGQASDDHWSLNGTSVYYSSGNVGVGVSAPAAKLDVINEVAITGTAGPLLKMQKNDGTLDNVLYYNNSNTTNKLMVGRDSSELGFRTSGAERMTVDVNGQVGIGTTVPSSILDIKGNSPKLLIEAENNDKPRIEFNRSASVINWRIVNDGAVFKTEFGDDSTSWSETYSVTSGLNHYWNTDQLVLASNGNLGLGAYPTSSSTYRTLNIVSSDASVGGAIRLSTSAGESAHMFNFDSAGYYGGDTATLLTTGDPAAGTLKVGYRIDASGLHRWYDPTDGTTERMRIDESGQVGIGGVVPSNLLHLKGDPKIRLEDDSPAATSILDGSSGNLLLRADLNAEQASTYIAFLMDGDSEKMRIDSNGHVGIGITPTATLHTYVASGTVRNLLQSGGTNATYTHYQNTNGNWYAGMTGSGDYQVYDNNALTSRFRIRSDGRVGINTSAPATILDIRDAKPVLRMVASTTTGTTLGNKGPKLLLESDSSTVGNGGEIVWTGQGDASGERWAAISGSIKVNSVNGCSGGLVFATKALDTDTSLTERMRVDAGGFVGINDSAPDEQLSVGGDIKIDNGVGAGVLHFGDTSDDTKIIGWGPFHSTSPNTMAFTIGGNQRLKVNSLGNVSIGTGGPTFTNGNYKTFFIKSDDGLAGGFLRMATSENENVDIFNYNGTAYVRADNSMIWQKQDGSNMMRLSAVNGLIVGPSSTHKDTLTLVPLNGDETATGVAGVMMNARARFAYDGSSVVISDNGAIKPITFTSGGAERMRIHTDGSVYWGDAGFIGNSSAGQFNYSDGTTAVGSKTVATYQRRSMIGWDGTRGSMVLGTTDGASARAIQFDTNAAGAVTFAADGNVGIGTTAPVNITNYTGLTLNDTASGSFVSLSQGGTEKARWITTSALTRFGTATAIPLEFATGGTNSADVRMTISSTGTVAIGKAANTSFQLDVDENLRAKRLYLSGDAKDQTGTFFYGDVAGRIRTLNDFYVDANSANTYLYSTNVYLGKTGGGTTVRYRGSTVTADAWGITSAGVATYTGLTMGSTNLRDSTDRAGILESHGTSGWQGFQATSGDEHLSLMIEPGGTGGLYDDTSGRWVLFKSASDNLSLYSAGVAKLTTKVAGVDVSGDCDVTGNVGANTVTGTWTNNGTANANAKIVVLTQAEYNAIGTKDSNTLYITT